LRALLDEYLAELSAYGEVNLSYPWLDAYWQLVEARWPYLIEGDDGAVQGFALVNTYAPDGLSSDFAMAEFYIVPSARRLGIGHLAAAATFRHHPGTWSLSVLRDNAAAQRFWPVAIAAAGARDIERVDVPDGVAYHFVIGTADR
jgi:predicted acetyltransferase